MNYRNWLRGGCGCGCNGTPRQINNCDCDTIWAEIENLHTDDEVLQQEIDDIDLSNYYTKLEVDTLIPTNLSELVNDEGFITIAALNGYATETWVQNQGYLTEHQHLKTVNNQSLIGDGNIVIEASGSPITVDSYLDPTSTNPVQNKVVTMALNNKLDASAYTPVDLSNYVTNAELIQYITNLQQQINSLQTSITECCGETGETLYRWVVMTGENDYLCSGTTKMTKEKKQQSSDGVNWVDVSPAEYRMGSTVLEVNSEDCGYVPVTTYKVKMNYVDGSEDNRICDSSTVLRWLNPSNWENISGVTVGDCITEIGDLCFYGFSGLTSVSLPNTITKIGGMAFNHCLALPSISIPATVTEIGSQAFGHCDSLQSVILPNGVEHLYYATFFECASLTNVRLSNSLKIIDNDAIKKCHRLVSLDLPSTLTSIGKHAFALNDLLLTVTCHATTPPAFHDSGETGSGGNQGDIFYACNNLYRIHVPAESVNAYKQAWPLYADLIVAI